MTQIGENVAARFGFGGPPKPGSLTVTVVERRSGEPVAGVTITASGPVVTSTVTASDGTAHLAALEPGLYSVAALQPEFHLDFSTALVVVGDGEAETVTLKVHRVLLTIVLKRIPIISRSAPGHWWTEIDETESYGWYPAEHPDPLWTGFTGVPGRLNGTRPHGTPTQDMHHGDNADDTFHPRVVNGKPAAIVKQCIRDFARRFTGTWSWPTGQNCHSFQLDLMASCDLVRIGGREIRRPETVRPRERK